MLCFALFKTVAENLVGFNERRAGNGNNSGRFLKKYKIVGTIHDWVQGINTVK